MDIQNIQGNTNVSPPSLKTPLNKISKKNNEVSDYSINAEVHSDTSLMKAQKNTVQNILVTIPDVRLEVVENIKARIKINDYPIPNKLDESLKKLLQSNILTPLF